MKEIAPMLTVIIILISIVFGVRYVINYDENSLKIGQTWKTSYYEDNPFKQDILEYKRIIDIQSDYVLYISDDKDTLNTSKRWFVVSSKCIKNCD